MAKKPTTQPKSTEETTVEETTDVQTTEVEQVEPVVEPTETEKEVTEETTDKTPETVESSDAEKAVDAENEERLKLAKELNLSIRRDVNTGKPILPSTPAMRAAAAAASRKTVLVHAGMDIEQYVIDTYGEELANNPDIKLIISTLSNYVRRMGPGASITEKEGGEVQSTVANLYDVVLSLKSEFAQVGLEIIVAVVKQNIRGAFAEVSALRFANTMPLNTERSIRFQLLTTLFITLASGTKKQNLAKVINVRQLVEYISDRNAKANISEFIN